jgi:hypothetical protein
MKKQILEIHAKETALQFALMNLRICVAFLFYLGGVSLGVLSFATTPSSITSGGVTLSPASIDFGYILVGASTEITETVTNSGTAPLVITDISVSGHDRGDFRPMYGFTLPVTVSPGSSLDIPLLFTPALPWRAGTRNARLEISERRDSQYVPLTGMGGNCGGPFPACLSGCPDTDGDGLNDAWELAGGIDLNNDGIVDASEQVLTNVDPLFPDGTPNGHPSADPSVKDIFVKYDWMELPDQLTNGQPTPCTVNPLPPGPNRFDVEYPYHSDQCGFDQACIEGFCRGHSDAPDGAALKMVIDAFARHNMRLHLVRGHAVPHSNVISFGTGLAACIADTSTVTFSGGQAVDFYVLKAANLSATYNGQNFTEGQLYPFIHYAVFGHRHTCDSRVDCEQSACFNPDTGRNPKFDESGLSEQPGNDIIVTLGFFHDIQSSSPPLLVQGGTFMHELGHNLGLDHGGPLFIDGVAQGDQVRLNFKPNYISVMNYNHQGRGISTASSDCAPDDYVCKTTPVTVRLDYSSFTDGVPNTLDENNGSEAAGLNLGNNDIGYNTSCGPARPIPGTGPVDFTCSGTLNKTWCGSGCDFPFRELNNNDGETPNGTPGSGDVLRPFEDWPNLIYAFQCKGTFDD